MSWKKYQIQAAQLFESVGCKAEIEAKVEGVRGKHEVDVYVTFEQYGINCNWVVECKCWNSNVPKEKVLALQAIVDDLGADRGILISKTGFQSGAIRSAQKSNISLTSLEDLREDLAQDVTRRTVDSLEASLLHTKNQIFDLSKTEKIGEGHWRSSYPDGISGKLAAEYGGKLCILETGFANLKMGKNLYPLKFSECGNKIETTESIEEFLEAVKNQITICTAWLTSVNEKSHNKQRNTDSGVDAPSPVR